MDSIVVNIIAIIGVVLFVLGLFLVISGFLNLKPNKPRPYIRIPIGIFILLLLPLLGQVSLPFQQRESEADVIGNYSKLNQSETLLKIFANKTFKIYPNENTLMKKGKWKVTINDFPTLHLVGLGHSTFESMYEISTSGKTVKLTPVFGDKDSGTLKMK